MSPAFIKGVAEHLPNARITFDKFHVVAHASTAVDKTRRLEQKSDPSLKGVRRALLKHRSCVPAQQRADLNAHVAQVTTKRTARAWPYREQLREILERKQINVVSALLNQWCTNVMRSKVEPMKEVARLIRNHFEGIVAWTQTRQTNGFIEALNGLFAGRQAQGARLHPLRNYANRALPHRRRARLLAHQPACRLTHSFSREPEFICHQ
jgi:transposase